MPEDVTNDFSQVESPLAHFENGFQSVRTTSLLSDLIFSVTVFVVLRYPMHNARELPLGEETDKYCKNCTGLTTLEGLRAACTEEGYLHSPLTTLRLRSGTCQMCKHILDSYMLDSNGDWKRQAIFIRLSARLGHTLTSDCSDSDVCHDHPLKGAVLDGFDVASSMDSEGKQNRSSPFPVWNAYSPEGDPAAGIIPRRPVLTDVGGATAMRLLRDRLSHCRSSHHQPLDGDIVHLPTRLLDLGMSSSTIIRLRSTKGELGTYCALSYCWGGEHQPTTVKANLTMRIASLNSTGLPRTIRDAITVARNLGFRFLWVDALCIVQDDPLDRETEIKAMGSIYRGAALTISASSSTRVSEGFLYPRSEPLSVQLPFALSKDLSGTIGLGKDANVDVKAEPLQQRGWALQEHALARRLAMFCTHEVIFRCCYLFEPIQESYISYYGFDYLTTQNPLICTKEITESLQRKHWPELVRYYSPRRFSEPEDRVNALIGIATELSKTCNDVYLIGLWRDSFIYHLGWYAPPYQQTPAHHRTRSNNLPTWTWLSLDAGTRITPGIEQPDAQLIQCGGGLGRNTALYSLNDLYASRSNREVQLRIRTMPASSYVRATHDGTYWSTEVYLDYSDSPEIPLDSTFALLRSRSGLDLPDGGNGTCSRILLLRPARADESKMERIGILISWQYSSCHDPWDDTQYVTVTLV